MRSRRILVLCAFSGLLAAGCPKGHDHYEAARKAEDLQDYDTALLYYQKALATDPQNADYRIKYNQIRFEAGEYHIKKGQGLREKGDLQGAAAEFQHAATIDPGSSIAVQELRNTVEQINDLARKQDEAAAGPNNTVESDLAAGPPELKPLSDAPVSLKMVNDVKVIFDTIAKQAGINVIYDPDFPARRVSVELNNVTLQQALDIVSMQSKTFWKPVTENIIFVAQDTTQKHKDYDEQMVETFYLSNTVQSQDLTEIANGLRQVLNLTKVQQLNSQNAIIVRDTPDKLAIARRLLKDIDKAKPEVVIQVEVLSASMDRLRDLGVLPGQTANIAFTPPGTTVVTSGSSGSNTGSTPSGAPLKGFSFGAGDFTITLPGATANFVLTDTASKIIQNPEIRSIDGQPAKLNIGSRVPIATGSFQAGVGVGTTSVNPLVNTQFTYIDVGVNVNITPRIHPNHEVSLKVALEVSQVTSFQTIGGIQQPVIGQNKIEHDIRLREGEASILGGLFSKTDSKTVNGWPGLAQIPLMKYLFSENKTDRQENDILIVLIPRIVRLPDWSRGDLRPISSGVEQNITVRRQSEIRTPGTQMPAQPTPAQPQPAPAQPPAAAPPQAANPQAAASGQSARLHFDPQALTLAPGQTATLGVAVENVNDLYSIPMMLQYDPAVISVEDIQHGTFLSSGNQEIAIVQGGDKSKGQIMIAATRQPNTPGVSGSGTLLGIVVRAVGAGASNVSIVQVNAKDSQQKPLPLITTEASIQVKPQ